MKDLKIEAIIIAIGLIGLGVCLYGGISKFMNKDRIVNVKGLAEMEVKANKVTWPIQFKETGNDLPTMYQSIDNTTRTVKEFLTGKGIDENEIAVGAPKVTDKFANEYNNFQHVQERYIISCIITVSTDKVDLVRTLIGQQSELLKKGVALVGDSWENPTTYEFTGLNDVKPQMIEEATKNARLAAEKFAKDSNSKLGEICNASQGQFTISDRDNYTPHIKNLRVVTTISYQLN